MELSITLIIIIITVFVSIGGFNNQKLQDDLIFYPPAVADGQWYRLFSCGLIHADVGHLLFNMFTLFFFGKALESLYMGELGLNRHYFILLYFLALIFSNIPTYLKRKEDYNYRSLGASGAVSAVLFAVNVGILLLDDPATLKWTKRCRFSKTPTSEHYSSLEAESFDFVQLGLKTTK